MFFILGELFFNYGPIAFAVAGFFLAGYVYSKKQKQEVLVCPMNGSCDEVVNSQYSKFLGIPVELMGILYYSLIILLYSYININYQTVSDGFKFFVTGITVGAFIFSCYLVFIQAFILKKWCTWCLFSAGFSTMIFITAIAGANFDLTALLIEYKGTIVLFHALAAAVGVGSATITDIFFFKFLKDYKISEGERSTMDTLSGVIWVALGVLVLTGVGLFIPNSQELLQNSKFVLKVVGVLVLIINGILLNLIISPKLIEISFGEDKLETKEELRFMRKFALALGGISISSWYMVFILGSLRKIPISTKTGLALYAGMLVLVIIFSQVFDKLMIAKRKKEGSSVK